MLTDNQKELIVAVAENNMLQAQVAAFKCLSENRYLKDATFCEEYSKKIRSNIFYANNMGGA